MIPAHVRMALSGRRRVHGVIVSRRPVLCGGGGGSGRGRGRGAYSCHLHHHHFPPLTAAPSQVVSRRQSLLLPSHRTMVWHAGYRDAAAAQELAQAIVLQRAAVDRLTEELAALSSSSSLSSSSDSVEHRKLVEQLKERQDRLQALLQQYKTVAGEDYDD